MLSILNKILLYIKVIKCGNTQTHTHKKNVYNYTVTRRKKPSEQTTMKV